MAGKPVVVDALPALPCAEAPAGTELLLSINEQLYRSDGERWVRVVDAGRSTESREPNNGWHSLVGGAR